MPQLAVDQPLRALAVASAGLPDVKEACERALLRAKVLERFHAAQPAAADAEVVRPALLALEAVRLSAAAPSRRRRHHHNHTPDVEAAELFSAALSLLHRLAVSFCAGLSRRSPAHTGPCMCSQCPSTLCAPRGVRCVALSAL